MTLLGLLFSSSIELVEAMTRIAMCSFVRMYMYIYTYIYISDAPPTCTRRLMLLDDIIWNNKYHHKATSILRISVFALRVRVYCVLDYQYSTNARCFGCSGCPCGLMFNICILRFVATDTVGSVVAPSWWANTLISQQAYILLNAFSITIVFTHRWQSKWYDV